MITFDDLREPVRPFFAYQWFGDYKASPWMWHFEFENYGLYLIHDSEMGRAVMTVG